MAEHRAGAVNRTCAEGPLAAGRGSRLRRQGPDRIPSSGASVHQRRDRLSTMLDANRALRLIEGRMRELEDQMGQPAISNDETAFERSAAHARAQEAFEQMDGYRYESGCRQALQAVGSKTRLRPPRRCVVRWAEEDVGPRTPSRAPLRCPLLDEPGITTSTWPARRASSASSRSFRAPSSLSPTTAICLTKQ